MAKLTVQRSAHALPPSTAACVGAFDGLHCGHQALLDRARGLGDRLALITFDPHPMQVLAPDRAPRLLHTPRQRERVAASLGVDHLVLLPFDRDMARLEPEAFVHQFLRTGLAPAAVVVGEDFRFGANRAGNPSMLAELLAPTRVEVVPAVPHPSGSGKLGSTDIRRAIDAGAVDEAALALGRYHAVHGHVVEGARRGRTLGFPTANVEYDGGYLPPLGVYATFATVWDPSSPDYGSVWPSVTNLGHAPTLRGSTSPVTLEAHIIDQELGERLYGVELEISFVARIRAERRFEGPASLAEQIDRDRDAARAILESADRNRVLTPPTDPRRP